MNLLKFLPKKHESSARNLLKFRSLFDNNGLNVTSCYDHLVCLENVSKHYRERIYIDVFLNNTFYDFLEFHREISMVIAIENCGTAL